MQAGGTLPLDTIHASDGEHDGLVTVDPAHYRIGDEIARGGVGLVRRAIECRTGREVALKELLTNAPRRRLRFAREARVTAQLQHPSIVPVYEIGRWPDGRPFYAMKLVAGRPLDAVVDQALDAEARLALIPRIVPAVEAIAYAHEKGVMHRDLKPSNVLLGEFGETVVIDWGLAKGVDEPDEVSLPAPGAVKPVSAARSGPALTAAGAVMGTPAYMPPEQALGDPVDARADVYSLGALLYHALSGHAPYEGGSPMAVLMAVLTRPPVPLSRRAPEAPADLVAIIEKAMAREPADRYPDARGLARDLSAFSTGRLVATYRYTSWELIKRFVRRNRALSLSVAILIVLVVGGSLAILQAYRDSERERGRAVAAERRATAEEHATHERLAHVHWRGAVRRLQERDHLGAELLAAAALLEHPDNPASPHHGLGAEGSTSPSERSARLSGPSATWGAARALRFASRGHSLSGHRDWIYDVLPSADGHWAVTTSADHDARIWDTHTGLLHRTLTGHSATVSQAALRADGGELATSSYDGTVRLWSFPKGDLIRTLRHSAGRVYGVCYAMDGRVFAVGLGGVLVVWDPASGSAVSELKVTPHLPWRLHCSAQAPVAALGTVGPEAILLDTTRPSVLRRVPHVETHVRGVVLSADATQMITADKLGVLRRFDVATGEVRAEAQIGGVYESLAISSDGRWLALGTEEVTIVDAGTFRAVARLHSQHITVAALAFDSSGHHLFSAGRDRRVIEWVIPQERAGQTLTVPGMGEIDTARVSPDGKTLAAAGDDAAVRVWDLSSGRLLHTMSGHSGPVRGLRFLDDAHLITTSMDRTLQIHTIGEPEKRSVVSLPHFGDEVSLSPEGEWIAVGGGDGSVVLFEMGTWRAHTIASVHKERTWWVGFDPTGRFLASASYSGSVAIIDPKTQTVTRTWPAHEGRIYAADFRPDGSELTTADLEGVVRGWNPETGARLREWRVLGGERIDAIAWSPSGEWLLITTADGMRVYRPDGTIEARLDLATRTKAAAWTKDGRMVFAGDRRIYVLPLDTQSWRADPQGLLGAAEAAAGTTLGAMFGIDDKKTSVPASLEGAR